MTNKVGLKDLLVMQPNDATTTGIKNYVEGGASLKKITRVVKQIMSNPNFSRAELINAKNHFVAAMNAKKACLDNEYKSSWKIKKIFLDVYNFVCAQLGRGSYQEAFSIYRELEQEILSDFYAENSAYFRVKDADLRKNTLKSADPVEAAKIARDEAIDVAVKDIGRKSEIIYFKGKSYPNKEEDRQMVGHALFNTAHKVVDRLIADLAADDFSSDEITEILANCHQGVATNALAGPNMFILNSFPESGFIVTGNSELLKTIRVPFHIEREGQAYCCQS